MSANEPWVDGLTIGEMLAATARRNPAGEAVVFPQFQYRRTFAELDADVDQVARALMALGLQRGEHVAVWGTNWPQWLLLQFATARMGAVLVTINPAYRSHELAYVLKQSDTVALFLVDKFRNSDYFGMLGETVPEVCQCGPEGWHCPAFPKLRQVVSFTDHPTLTGVNGWQAFLERASQVEETELREREGTLTPADPINIQYTSGTTGFPKGATLTHRNLLMNAYHVGDAQKLTESDRVCVPVPFYHCFGCVLGILCCAVHGAAMVVPHEYFRATETLVALEQERATAVYGVPTMFIAMLDDPTRAKRDLSSLRTGIMAGSPCPIEIMQRVVKELGAREVTIAYGLTEASPVITQTRTDDSLELRVKTVGRPLPGWEVKLVDPVSGQAAEEGRQGELCARGHGVMLGYYNMPDQTAEAIDTEGWLHSGDLATRLPSGYYRITGRMKEMVIRGGENIYPREIEEFLFTNPAIQNVAVVGVPDPKYIEELAAWIQLKPGSTLTEDEVRLFCKGQLAHYKIPRYIHFVTEFPQTVTGKIQKFKMREVMIETHGLKTAAAMETA